MRKTKKSETLQVRLPYGMKRDFMDRVKLENRSASDLIRDFIDDYLAGPVEILNSPKAAMIRRRFIYPSLMAAGLVGAVVAFIPNPGSAGTLEPEFAEIDADRNGFISAAEFKLPGPEKLLHPVLRSSPRPRPGPDGIVMHDADGKPLKVRTLRPDEEKAPPVAQPGEVLLTRLQMSQHLLGYFDANLDQKLSFEEYKAARIRGARASFDRYDADLDDRVTEDEYIKSRIPALNPDFVASLPPERRDASVASIDRMRIRVIENFKSLDLNGDGVVTRDEILPS